MHCVYVQEIELLRSLSFDANIVQFYGACLQEENTMMVLEFMAVRTLFHIVICTCFVSPYVHILFFMPFLFSATVAASLQ